MLKRDPSFFYILKEPSNNNIVNQPLSVIKEAHQHNKKTMLSFIKHIKTYYMPYRTRTYIAGEWDGDSNAIDQLYRWNEGDKWKLHFVDAHMHKQCYDSSMPCTIKSSLSERMSRSKVFILIVGNNTISARKGSCFYQNCGNKYYNYYSNQYMCNVIGKSYSTESFIDYECRLAYNAWRNGEMKIVVLYNAASVNKSKCPELLRNVGSHESMKSYNYFWQDYRYDYQKVRSVIED